MCNFQGVDFWSAPGSFLTQWSGGLGGQLWPPNLVKKDEGQLAPKPTSNMKFPPISDHWLMFGEFDNI